MHMTFTGDDRVLLDRYIESVLLRFGDSRYDLQDATKELDRAQKKMEDLLDEGDNSVKQTDLLELKATDAEQRPAQKLN